MPNQMIALQGRTPQGFDVGRMVQQNSQLINMMSQQRAADRQAAAFEMQRQQTAQEMGFAQNQEDRTARLAVPQQTEAEAKSGTARLELFGNFLDASAEAIYSARNPQEATAQGQRLKEMFPAGPFVQYVDETLASIPQDPAQFEAWRTDSLRRTMTAAQQNQQELREYNTGLETGLLAIPTFRGAPGGDNATVVPGSRVQAAQGIRFVRMPDGSIVPQPDTMPNTGGPVGAGTGGSGGGSSTFDRMINRESRGQQFARDGSPLTSPAGAIGVAQVMPGTAPEAAQLAGLPFDDYRFRNDREYNLALGRAYYEKQLADFGDEALAAAAYNAGPGRVRRALDRGGPDGWLQHVPRETRDYVAAVMGGGAGTGGGSNQPAGAGTGGGMQFGQPLEGTGPSEVSAGQRARSVAEFKRITGVDIERGGPDPVADLIRGSTSGYLETGAAMLNEELPEFMGGGTTPGMENIGRLGVIGSQIMMSLLNGKLGAGISNADREAIERLVGNIQDPTLGSGRRLAAWSQLQGYMQRIAGVEETAPTTRRSTNGARPAAGSGVDMNNPLLRGM